MAKNNEKKTRKIRTDRELAFDNARKVMSYWVKVNRWDMVEVMTPMLKELGTDDDAPQVELPGTD